VITLSLLPNRVPPGNWDLRARPDL
jgi:hypothetical protein